MLSIKDIEFSRLRLIKIHEIWDRYILNYKICQKFINFNEDTKTNFVEDVLSYFKESLDLLEKNCYPKNKKDNFSSAIVFLQTIFIQQDFIAELLIIFKTKIVVGDLIQDGNYKINRDIRNELVGHPLRYTKTGKKELISTALFHYEISGIDKISYLRYHKDNSFKQELLSYSKEDILNRHLIFLNKYLDSILNVLNKTIQMYSKHINHISDQLDKMPFSQLISYTSTTFEYIYRSYSYDQEHLIEIYSRKDTHIRYQNYIDKFYNSMKVCISEELQEIKILLEPIPEKIISKKRRTNFKIVFSDYSANNNKKEVLPHTYTYELSKLCNPNDDFELFSKILADKCRYNQLVIDELENMRLNLQNTIEYDCSYYLICHSLDY